MKTNYAVSFNSQLAFCLVKVNDILIMDSGDSSTGTMFAGQTVSADNKGIARLGDSLESHGNHSRTIVSSSGSVFVDGKPAARNGDKIHCGGVLAGDSTVKVG